MPEELVQALGGGAWSVGPGRSVRVDEVEKYEAVVVMCALFFPFGFLYFLRVTYFWWALDDECSNGAVSKICACCRLSDPPSFFCCFLSICHLLRILSIDPLRCTPISAAQKEQFLQTLDISSIHDSSAQLLPPTSHLSKTVLHTSALPFQLRLTRCTVVCRIPRAPNVTLRLHPRTLLSGSDESLRFA